MLFPKLRQKKRQPEGPTLHGEPVTMGQLRSYVFERDRFCVAAVFSTRGGQPHECRDSFGTTIEPTDWWRMQLAHVPGQNENAYGRKPHDDELHTVMECAAANVFPGPSQELREFERRWIAEHEPGG